MNWVFIFLNSVSGDDAMKAFFVLDSVFWALYSAWNHRRLHLSQVCSKERWELCWKQLVCGLNILFFPFDLLYDLGFYLFILDLTLCFVSFTLRLPNMCFSTWNFQCYWSLLLFHAICLVKFLYVLCYYEFQIFCSFPFYMWLSENFLLSPLVKSKPTPLNSSSFKDIAQQNTHIQHTA